MKTGLTLKFLLKATAACILLTLVKILFNQFTNIHRFTRTDIKEIVAWIVLGIAWIIYLIDVIRSRRKDKENEPWNRKEKDPW